MRTHELNQIGESFHKAKARQSSVARKAGDVARRELENGAQKNHIAAALGVSRATLDSWLALPTD